jgi:triosephosphate isomerase
VAEVCKGSKVKVGAEDVFIEDKGAFTGGVAISQVLVFLPSLFLRIKALT